MHVTRRIMALTDAVSEFVAAWCQALRTSPNILIYSYVVIDIFPAYVNSMNIKCSCHDYIL